MARRWRCRGACRCWRTSASASSASGPSRSRAARPGRSSSTTWNSTARPAGRSTSSDGGALFEDIFLSVWRGDADNDGYNGLAQSAGLWSREIVILRAYGRYLQQAGIPQSQDFIAAVLNRYPDIARGLFQLFVALFDPKADRRRR